MDRFWNDAREKCREEGQCRVCGETNFQMAHIAHRRYDLNTLDDDPFWPMQSVMSSVPAMSRRGILTLVENAKDPKKVLYVHPHSVVPLCLSCHDRYDCRARPGLDLIPYLTASEAAFCVAVMGLESAYRRMSA